MSRPLRIEFPHVYYHVMNRGLAYQAIFTDREDWELFLTLLAECHEMWGVRVIAYCLLDNHYHLLIHTPEANLSRVMRHLDGLYTQRYNRRHRRDGPLFRGRYKAIVVDADEYLLAVARYIHYNLVAAGLVQFPEAYEWSSCRLYVEDRRRPVWLDTEKVLGWFPQEDRVRTFLAFMRSDSEDPVRAFYEAKRTGPVLGSRHFIDRMREQIGKKHADLTEVPQAKPCVRLVWKTCVEVVRRVYGIGEGDLTASRRGQRNEARAMAMYLCRTMAGMKHDEIAKVFGAGGYSAVSSVIGRTHAELAKGGKILQRYKQMRDLLRR